MKIICISGSPRKSGNTVRVFKEMKKELKNSYQVDTICLTDYEINGCIGCSKCQKEIECIGCAQKDDVDMLLKKIINADIIFYGTPLYGHSYSGQLKLFLDRHVALFKFIAGADKSVDEMKIFSFIKDKPVGLVVCCQGPVENNTELIKAQFDKFCESSLTMQIGKYIFPFCNDDSDSSILSTETLKTIVKEIEDLRYSFSDSVNI